MYNQALSLAWSAWPAPGLTKLWLSTVTMVTKHNEPFCILPVSQHWAAVKAIGVTKQHRRRNLQPRGISLSRYRPDGILLWVFCFFLLPPIVFGIAPVIGHENNSYNAAAASHLHVHKKLTPPQERKIWIKNISDVGQWTQQKWANFLLSFFSHTTTESVC